jgi:hypothetical protein
MLKSSLVKIEIGDKVLYKRSDSEMIEVVIKSVVMTPNGSYDPSLVTLISSTDENGNSYQATSDKFFASKNEIYKEFYPSVHFSHLNDVPKTSRFDFLFNRWTKWEIHEENLPYIKTEINPTTGWESGHTRVIVDIYVKENKFTGLKKYKKVIKK